MADHVVDSVSKERPLAHRCTAARHHDEIDVGLGPVDDRLLVVVGYDHVGMDGGTESMAEVGDLAHEILADLNCFPSRLIVAKSDSTIATADHVYDVDDYVAVASQGESDLGGVTVAFVSSHGEKNAMQMKGLGTFI